MSNNDKTDETLPQDDNDANAEDVAPDAVAEMEAETEPEPEPEPEPESDAGQTAETQQAAPRPARKGGGFVAWFALLLSLAALSAIGWSLFEDWRAQSSADAAASSIANSVAELSGRVGASNEALAGLDSSVAELGDAAARSAAELDALRRELDDRIGLLDSLPARMSTLENSLASLQGISSGARDTWLLAEAEYYMQIANAQLQLAGNPQLATLALGMADERVVQLADPALTAVRRAISDELAALEVMEKPDIEGVTLTLSSLARVVDSLPLRQRNEADAENAVEPDAALSGVDRAWNAVKGAVSGLVKVTPPADQATMPLIAPEAVYFLRTNLTLQLQSARLALLRGETAVFEASLDDAAAWLGQYFDARSAPVASAMETIDEIRGGMFAVAPPDISGSLRLLRQYRTLAETAQ